MLELPEAQVLAHQINTALVGRMIVKAEAAHTPHKFTWYCGDPGGYNRLLAGKTVDAAQGLGGMVEIKSDAVTILISDGVALKLHVPGAPRPPKHQLLLEFEDASAVSATVQMYGGIQCFADRDFDDSYYRAARKKPSPLTDEFSEDYFATLLESPDNQKLSAKAFLATGQRIPGLGNGVLQDILWNAKIHPKCKIATLANSEKTLLFSAVKTVLVAMTLQGGRDTEKDLYGKSGGYKTVLSKNSAGFACPRCDGLIKKANYFGGSIYYCENCQPL